MGLIGSFIAIYVVHINPEDSPDSFRPLFVIAAFATFLGGMME